MFLGKIVFGKCFYSLKVVLAVSFLERHFPLANLAHHLARIIRILLSEVDLRDNSSSWRSDASLSVLEFLIRSFGELVLNSFFPTIWIIWRFLWKCRLLLLIFLLLNKFVYQSGIFIVYLCKLRTALVRSKPDTFSSLFLALILLSSLFLFSLFLFLTIPLAFSKFDCF